jgi:hypothetical protein
MLKNLTLFIFSIISAVLCLNKKSRYWELNPGPFTYKANALPLSYTGGAIKLSGIFLKYVNSMCIFQYFFNDI